MDVPEEEVPKKKKAFMYRFGRGNMTSGSQGDRAAWWQVEPWSSWAVTLANSHQPFQSGILGSWGDHSGCGFLERQCTVSGAVWKTDALCIHLEDGCSVHRHSREDDPPAAHTGI